nr:DUF5990 family protein [Rhodococcus wratislaviensis]
MIEATDLPGSSCPPGANFPGYDNIHVAVQRRGAHGDLLGLHPGDATTARWVLDCKTTPTPTGLDITGPYVQGRPGARFVYLSWGPVDADGRFDMFRRAKLMWDAVDPATVTRRRLPVASRRGSGSPTPGEIRCALRCVRRWSSGRRSRSPYPLRVG